MESGLSTRSTGRVDYLANAIDYNVNGITVRGIHGGEIRVSGHHDTTLAGMVFQILLHNLLRFGDVHRQNYQTLVGKLSGYVIDQRVSARHAGGGFARRDGGLPSPLPPSETGLSLT